MEALPEVHFNATNGIVKKRVILRDVARKAGIHLTTAARAMRNDPRVAPKTLARVRAIAGKLGYVADPMLSALSAYRHAGRPSRYHGTLGWITNYPTRDGWRCEPFRLYRDGAAAALARQGYHLEDVWLREPGLTARRASQILRSRGIRGLLVCPLPMSHGHLGLEWDRFAAVAFGYTLHRPALHFATAAHYNGLRTCMRKLRELGHGRIGVVIPEEIDRRMEQLWSAAYQVEFLSASARAATSCGKPVPILLLKEAPAPQSEARRAAFLKWFRAHRPEAVIAFGDFFREWLEDEGLRIPGDVGFVSPTLPESDKETSGIVESSREIGRTAADLLVGMLRRGEFGIPRLPQRILLEGEWQAGKTVARRSPARIAR